MCNGLGQGRKELAMLRVGFGDCGGDSHPRAPALAPARLPSPSSILGPHPLSLPKSLSSSQLPHHDPSLIGALPAIVPLWPPSVGGMPLSCRWWRPKPRSPPPWWTFSRHP
jgi:hypothetical protein